MAARKPRQTPFAHTPTLAPILKALESGPKTAAELGAIIGKHADAVVSCIYGVPAQIAVVNPGQRPALYALKPGTPPGNAGRVKLGRVDAVALLGRLVADGHQDLILEVADTIRKSREQQAAAQPGDADCRIVWNLPPVREFRHQNGPPIWRNRPKSNPGNALGNS